MSGMKLEGTLAGAAGAALWWWAQDNQDRDDRLRTTQLDNRALTQRMNALLSSADWIRLTSPAVRDASVGIAAATPTSAPAQTVPPITATASRPDLSDGANIAKMQWPPKVGQYDGTGRTSEPGELALSAYAQTYQEPRAWNQGLTQSKAPTGVELEQLFWAAQGLSAVAMSMRYTAAQWKSLWQALFTSATPPPLTPPSPPPPLPPAVDPHQDPQRVPGVASANTNITQVMPQPVAIAGPTTDATQRWNVTQAAGSTIAAGQPLFTVTYSAQYRYRDNSGNVVPITPLVMTTDPSNFAIANSSPTGFTVKSMQSQVIPSGSPATYPVNIIVAPGVQTVS